jgi:glycosyltransferase involved in cell wall biosynthesis
VVAVSETTRREILDLGVLAEERAVVVPNAADHLPVPSPSPQRLEDLVVVVGHLERRKGSDLLLEAFARLRARCPAARLRLAGRGPLEASLRSRAQALGIEASVEIRPAESDAELADLYARAAVVAVPSRLEGFGIPLLEALRCGAPTVAADAGALPEVGASATLLVSGFEPGPWASALERVLTDQDLRLRLATAGPRRAAAYSWRSSARVLRELFADLTDG